MVESQHIDFSASRRALQRELNAGAPGGKTHLERPADLKQKSTTTAAPLPASSTTGVKKIIHPATVDKVAEREIVHETERENLQKVHIQPVIEKQDVITREHAVAPVQQRRETLPAETRETFVAGSRDLETTRAGLVKPVTTQRQTLPAEFSREKQTALAGERVQIEAERHVFPHVERTIEKPVEVLRERNVTEVIHEAPEVRTLPARELTTTASVAPMPAAAPAPAPAAAAPVQVNVQVQQQQPAPAPKPVAAKAWRTHRRVEPSGPPEHALYMIFKPLLSEARVDDDELIWRRSTMWHGMTLLASIKGKPGKRKYKAKLEQTDKRWGEQEYAAKGMSRDAALMAVCDAFEADYTRHKTKWRRERMDASPASPPSPYFRISPHSP